MRTSSPAFVAAPPSGPAVEPADQRSGGGVGWPAARVFKTAKLPGGWPLIVLYLGFPLWWVLGLSELIFIIMAIPMTVRLVKQAPLRLPRGFGLWLLFLVWVAIGIFVLAVPAPLSVQDAGGIGRYMTYAYRLAMYLAITVVLLYVGNLREKELSTTRVGRLLGFMFVLTAIGGLVGTFVPPTEFKSAIEYILPGALRANGFVESLVHPKTAELQTVLGYAEARPVAPYNYANSWGANYSFFLPYFLLAWMGKGAGWRRYLAPVVLIASFIPVVYSLNRGLWLAIGLGLVYVAFRLAAMGRIVALQGIVAGFVLLAVLFVFSPLGNIVNERLDNPHSNARRSELSTVTFQSAAAGSPIIGFGTTRHVQGSFASIAGGSTAKCPACGVPPMGTQGTIWSVIFFQGLVGTAMFLGFFLYRFFRHWRDRSAYAIAGSAVLLMATLEMFVYDYNAPALFTIMIALGLMWRREQSLHEPTEDDDDEEAMVPA